MSNNQSEHISLDEARPADARGCGSNTREEAADALLDLKNPHKWDSPIQKLKPWQPQRQMIGRWWKDQNVIELVISQVREAVGGKRNKKTSDEKLTEEENEYLREDREEESRLRAKGAVRRRLLTIGADHLLTLTYRDNVTEVAKAEEDLRQFLKLVRERYPEYPYVAVWERQKRGAIHWHLGVPGFQDVRFLRKCWRKVVGHDNGNIDVTPPRGKRSVYASLASYIAKYILKGQEERRRGQHRYRCSVGIVVHKEVYRLGAISLEEAIEIGKDLVRDLLGVEKPVVFTGGGLYDWAFVAGYG